MLSAILGTMGTNINEVELLTEFTLLEKNVDRQETKTLAWP